MGTPSRLAEDISKEGFTNFANHNKEEFAKFLKIYTSKNYFKIAKTSNIKANDFKFIGSDLSSKSIGAFINNCKSANLNKFQIPFKPKNGDDVVANNDDNDKISNPNILFEKINNSFEVYMGDFETIGQNTIFQDGDRSSKNKFTIITNIPYGTSSEMSNRNQIKSLYRRFGKFLRKNIDYIDEVYVLVNKRNSNDDLNFKELSEINWECVVSFNNNGIDVVFLHYSKNLAAAKAEKALVKM